MTDAIRVRYAPSPTGLPHVGNIRTALFNWLFARHHGGTFIVRIEDTDVARRVEGAVEAILDSLRWLGLDWDEGPEAGGDYGPYFQSQRLDLYRRAAERLVDQGNAYPCYCSSQRLEEMRAEQMRRKQPPGYDRRCRILSVEQRRAFENQGIVPVIRFKVPTQGETRFDDLIRGEVVFANSTLDDFVLLKSDGYPTYHLANIVDDHAMRISHVLRADEWLASTPRHVLLYAAMGYQPPLFAHLPMILGPDRSKLSKRHGATALTEYRDAGYLPQAMMNFLALLGWSLDDHTEIFSREQLVQHFSLERIGKTGAIFNIDKLKWMNGVYIRTLDTKRLVDQVMPFLEKDLPPEIKRPLDREHLAMIMALIQERLVTLKDTSELCDFFFLERLDYDPAWLLGKKLNKEMAVQALQAALSRLKDISFDHDSLEKDFRALAETLGLKTGDFFGLIRVAATGRTAAPPLFQTMVVLGREKCFQRIEAALTKLQEL